VVAELSGVLSSGDSRAISIAHPIMRWIPESQPKMPAAPNEGNLAILDKLWIGPEKLNMRRAAIVVFFVVAALLFIRQPAAIFQAGFYGEDGKIFFKQQYEMGFRDSVITPYAGYLPTAPRIVAWACSVLPLEYLPFAYAMISLLAAAGVLAFFCLPNFRHVIKSDSLRITLVMVFTLMPNAEPLMKAAFLGWYLLFFLALVTLMELPQRLPAFWLLLLPAVLTAWTTPVAIVCLPLTVLRAWMTKDVRERAWWSVLTLALITYPLMAERPPGLMAMLLHDSDWKLALVRCIGYRVFCFFFFGQTAMYPFPSEGWNVILGISLVLAVICVAIAIRLARQHSRSGLSRWSSIILLYLILGLPAMFVLRTQWLRYFLPWDEACWEFNGRYFFCSTLLMGVFWGVAYERLWFEWFTNKISRRQWATVLMIAWLSLHIASFRLDSWNIHTPWSHFSEQIRAAQVRADQSGKRELVYVATRAAGFDFDLVVKPKAPKPADQSSAR
jgi:hypothetical protein